MANKYFGKRMEMDEREETWMAPWCSQNIYNVIQSYSLLGPGAAADTLADTLWWILLAANYKFKIEIEVWHTCEHSLTQPTSRRPTKQFPFLFPCHPALLYTCFCVIVSCWWCRGSCDMLWNCLYNLDAWGRRFDSGWHPFFFFFQLFFQLFLRNSLHNEGCLFNL